MLDLESRGHRCEPHRRHCVASPYSNYYPGSYPIITINCLLRRYAKNEKKQSYIKKMFALFRLIFEFLGVGILFLFKESDKMSFLMISKYFGFHWTS